MTSHRRIVKTDIKEVLSSKHNCTSNRMVSVRYMLDLILPVIHQIIVTADRVQKVIRVKMKGHNVDSPIVQPIVAIKTKDILTCRFSNAMIKSIRQSSINREWKRTNLPREGVNYGLCRVSWSVIDHHNLYIGEKTIRQGWSYGPANILFLIIDRYKDRCSHWIESCSIALCFCRVDNDGLLYISESRTDAGMESLIS